MTRNAAIWVIVVFATGGVIIRPWKITEAVWAVIGAVLLVVLGLLPLRNVILGVAKGTDVYLFLIGMMLLSEIARSEGLFDWLAAYAARSAGGSAKRLFTLVYLVGTLVTVFLSNDATAVVLTPAVAAMVRAARAEQPLPYLFICAFIANAASFVLPISNPANLVIYGTHMPPLLHWLQRYILPSLLSIAATYVVLRATQNVALRQAISAEISSVPLSVGGKTAAAGIAATAVLLMVASGWGFQLGLPTFLAGIATTAVVLLRSRAAPWPILRDVSWNVVPLVAGLFVLVEGLSSTGIIARLGAGMHSLAQHSASAAAWGAGTALALVCNVTNNLPAGLIAATAVQTSSVPPVVTSAVLIGVDLGPNLSVTGSLATILWLSALQREGFSIGAWAFLKLGALVMPPALILAIGAALLEIYW